MILHIKLPQEADLDSRLEQCGLELLDYDKRWKNYRVRLSAAEVDKHQALLKELLEMAYRRRRSE